MQLYWSTESYWQHGACCWRHDITFALLHIVTFIWDPHTNSSTWLCKQLGEVFMAAWMTWGKSSAKCKKLKLWFEDERLAMTVRHTVVFVIFVDYTSDALWEACQSFDINAILDIPFLSNFDIFVDTHYLYKTKLCYMYHLCNQVSIFYLFFPLARSKGLAVCTQYINHLSF